MTFIRINGQSSPGMDMLDVRQTKLLKKRWKIGGKKDDDKVNPKKVAKGKGTTSQRNKDYYSPAKRIRRRTHGAPGALGSVTDDKV